MAKFNEACRTSVLRYTNDWERYVTRQARWVDFANDYKTLDLDYMESVMWAFKTLCDKGLVYEGFRVLAYCWRCETPLSNTETRMDDVYRDRQDPAVTVGFRLTLRDRAGRCAGADLDHHAVDAAVQPGARRRPGHRLRGGARRTASATSWPRPGSAHYANELGERAERAAHACTGAELVGRRYTPLFDFLAEPRPNAYQVLGADFVTTEDGTGVVHLAPAFGEDDQNVCRRGRHPDRRDRRRPHAVHRAGAAVRGPAGLRGQQADHPRPADGAARRACCCGTRPTTTRTRTAGAATPR